MTKVLTIAAVVIINAIRRKDAYVLLILLAAILTVLLSFNAFGLGEATGYIKDAGLLMTWFFSWIMAIIASTRELPREEDRGTIYSLLSKPVTRREVILGKWLGAWLSAVSATAAFYLMIYAFVKLKGGVMGVSITVMGFVAHAAVLAIISSAGIAFSTRMNHDAASSLTFIFTVVSFFVVPRIPAFLALERGIKAGVLLFIYNLLPHFEVLDFRRRIVHDYGPVDATTFLSVLLYACVVSFFFLTLACISYGNKRLVRGKLGE